MNTTTWLYSITVTVMPSCAGRKAFLAKEGIPCSDRAFVRSLKARALRLHNEAIDAMFPGHNMERRTETGG